MRIAYVVHQFMPEFSSGTEQFTYNVARAMQRAGHYVHVLTCATKPEAADLWRTEPGSPLRHAVTKSVPVCAVPRPLLNAAAEIGLEPPTGAAQRLFAQFFEVGKFDVCHITHTMRMAGAVRALTEQRIPYIVTLTDFFLSCYRINLIDIHGNYCSGARGGENCAQRCLCPPWTTDSLFERRNIATKILSGAESRVTCSDFVKSVFVSEFPEMDFAVLRHGVDLLKFPGTMKRKSLDREAIIFGYIGTLSEMKGVHVLAKAFGNVKDPRIRLRIVGPSYGDTQFADRIRQVAATDSRISIEAPRPHEAIPDLLSEFDLLCLPSLLPEAGSLSIQEGFAAGLPAIVSELGFLAECIKEYRCGLVVPPADIGAWTQAIERVAGEPTIIDTWRKTVPVPRRLEEEAAMYEALYRHAAMQRC